MERRLARFTQVILIEDMAFGGGPFPSGPLPTAEAPAIDGKAVGSFSCSSHPLADLKRRTGRPTAQP